jgi:hypothetical protein
MAKYLRADQSGKCNPALRAGTFFSWFLLMVLVAPSPARAQDLIPLVIILAPAFLLAPLGAAAVKGFILAIRGTGQRRRVVLAALLGLAAMEFVLWQILYPLGALWDLRIIPGWRGIYLLVAGLAILGFLTAMNRRLILWAGRHESEKDNTPEASPTAGRIGRNALALFFALSTPITLLALGAIAFAVAQ